MNHVHTVLDELRYAMRVLSRRRMFAFVAISTLGLGIGLATTMFGIVNGAVLKGLPVTSPDDLRYVERTVASDQAVRPDVLLPDFLEIARDARSFASMAAFRLETMNLSGTEVRPERYSGAVATANLFDVLGVRPRIGRAFLAREDAPGAAPVAIVSDRVWRDHFEDAPEIRGQSLRVDGVTHAVVGVMPPGFRYPLNQDVWIPMSIDPGAGREAVSVVARLAPGVSEAAAQAELQSLAARLADARPATNRDTGLALRTHISKFLGDEALSVFFSALLAAVGVLLIASTNVTNLLAALASVRVRELAVRAALGATRARVITQVMVEALVLAAAGGLVGFGLARVGVMWFTGAIDETNPPFWVDIRLDLTEALAVAALVSIVTVIAGTAPAIRAAGARAAEIIKDEVRGSTGGRLGRISRVLVVAEVAVSFGLLLVAGLMVRTMLTVSSADPGFSTDELLTGGVSLPARTYPDAVRQDRFWSSLVDRLERHPGVRAAALTSSVPGTGTGWTAVALDGVAYDSPRDYPRIRRLVVTPRFFETFDLQMVDGRAFAAGDAAEGPRVVIVNQAAAIRFFGDESPLGRRLLIASGGAPPAPATIVGVAPRMSLGGVRDPNPAAIYLPLAQQPQAAMNVVVGTFGDPRALASGLRDAVAVIDPDLPVYSVQSMKQALHLTTWFYGVFGTIFVLFGIVALVMVVAGLYGLMAFSVARRTREIGVRMAVGARPSDVLRLLLRQAAVQMGVGLLAGSVLAAWLARLLVALLVDVQPWDPVVLSVIVAGLLLTGLLACLGPALRAMRVSPSEALRHD